MIKVPAVSRKDIERWDVSNCGLPARVVNCATAAGYRTLGALREAEPHDLLSLRHFGRTSLVDLRQFGRLCDRLADGQLTFKNVREVFDLALNKAQWEVITERYGLFREELDASSDFYTLQEIGNRDNLTRERVRQVEALALEHLRGRLIAACLLPVRAKFRAFIEAQGGVASFASFAGWGKDPDLSRMNPCALALLLSDLAPGSWIRYRRSYSLLSAAALSRVETRLAAAVRKAGRPVRIGEVAAALPASARPKGLGEGGLSALLAQTPRVLATADGRFFVPAVAAQVIAEVAGSGKAEHFEDVARRFNALLLPGSRKSPGFVMKAMGGSGLFRRKGAGQYRLVANKS